MKKLLYGIGLAVLLPAFAFADDHMGPPPPPGADGTFNGAAHVQFQGDGVEGDVYMQGNAGMMQGEHEDGDWHAPASGTPPMMNASGTPWMRGDKRGLEMHDGTSTPPGHMATGTREMMRDASSSDDRASSTPERRFQNVIPFFLQWLFQMPASTTVGDIQAQIEASTSASVSASSSDSMQPPRGNFLQDFFRSLGGLFGR